MGQISIESVNYEQYHKQYENIKYKQHSTSPKKANLKHDIKDINAIKDHSIQISEPRNVKINGNGRKKSTVHSGTAGSIGIESKVKSEAIDKSVNVSEKEIPLMKHKSNKSNNSSLKSPKNIDKSITNSKTKNNADSKESNNTIKTPIQSSNTSRNIRNRSSAKNNNNYSNENSIPKNSISNSTKNKNKFDKPTGINSNARDIHPIQQLKIDKSTK